MNNNNRLPEDLITKPGSASFELRNYLNRARRSEPLLSAISLVSPKPSSEEVSSSSYSHLSAPLGYSSDYSSGDEQDLSEDELSDPEPSSSRLFTLPLSSNALTYDSDFGFGNRTPLGAGKTPSGSNSSAEQEDSDSD